jgi:hypothetical protein
MGSFFASSAQAQLANERSKGASNAVPISAQARAAARTVADTHERERKVRNELQEFAVELERVRNLLIRFVNSRSSEDFSKLEDQTRRLRASFAVVKARAPQRLESATAATAMEERCLRVFQALEAIGSETDQRTRAFKAATLLGELNEQSLERKRLLPPTPVFRTKLIDENGPSTTRGTGVTK